MLVQSGLPRPRRITVRRGRILSYRFALTWSRRSGDDEHHDEARAVHFRAERALLAMQGERAVVARDAVSAGRAVSYDATEMAYGTLGSPESVRKSLGQHLRKARNQGGFTVAALAEALSVAPTFVRAVERGEVGCDVWYVRRLLKQCGMSEACPR
jgi:hypothetical protein